MPNERWKDLLKDYSTEELYDAFEARKKLDRENQLKQQEEINKTMFKNIDALINFTTHKPNRGCDDNSYWLDEEFGRVSCYRCAFLEFKSSGLIPRWYEVDVSLEISEI